MKRNKWQRLAAIGLCGSLLVNAFSGVTAVAETVTIESSPTAESSVKEETQASSETQETMTETSREEVTQKTEKQAEVAAEKKEDTTVKAEPKEVEAQQEAQPTPQPPVQIQNRAIGVKAGNLVSLDSQFRELSRNERNRSQLVTPEARLGLNITSKDNTPLNTSDFKLKTEMGLTRWIRTTTTSGLFVISDETMVAPNVPTETGIDIILPSQTAVIGFVYRSDLSLYYLKDPELTVPKYIDTVELKEPVDGYTYRRYFGATGIGNPPNVGDYPMNVSLVKTNGMYVINQPKAAVWPVSPAPPLAYQAEIRSSPAASTENYNVSASGFYAMQQDYALVVTHKKVTENFVDATGAKITPPTGFTQGQQTSITSNDFTYTSAKALPDTYKAGGKTYKFKGWYKGKTKPATLKTTKTPSYDVTYDDNDDLNVVYEEAVEFPEETYQFGFVNQDGRLVKPDDITITYDYSEFLTNNGTNTWNGIALNQKAITEEKLKKITMPKSSLPKNTVNGEAMINISFSLPKYYTGLSIYDKSGKIDSNYPLPPRHYYMDNQEVIGMPSDATFINWLTLAKAADNSYVFKDALTSPLPINSSFPMMRRGVTGYTYYHSLDAPVYYHLTQRKVTENFVDATGAKITPPTGFTQGQQTSITSNDFTYTSAKALPDTYKADGKTYKFKGWYKGKTKPATLKTTKTPSYGVTYDDNDDMTAVYEEVMTKTYNLPAKDVYFGYVDEAGNLLNPADFTVEAELGESTATESAVLGKVQGTNQVTSKLKKLSIPGKSYDFPVAEIKTYGTRYVNHTIPKRYKTMSISPTATYTGDKTKYPVPDGLRQNIDNPTITVTTPGTSSYKLSTNGIVFGTDRKYWTWDTNKTWYAMGIYSGVVGWNYNLLTPTGTIYYYLENRRITENFVDSNGTKITPPTGFTQGKQTVIDSDNFTYTSAKALPASYTVGDKNYKFKGWYKGTDQTALKTTKTPSYTVTYDGKDDMTAVYEEVQDTTVYPGFYAEFFDEQGKAFTNPLTLSGNYTEYLRKIDNSPFEATGSLYPMVGSKDATVANRYKVETKQSVSIPNNFFEDYPADILHKGFALNNFDITNELKYVDQVEATTKTITLYDYDTISDIGTNLLSDSVTASLNSFETVFNREVNNTFSVKAKWGQPGIARETIPNLLALGSISSKPRLLGFDGTSDYKQTINYKVTRKQVTENFVDAAGVKISAPTGFTQGKQTPMTSNSFKYTAAKALPASYSAGGKTYTFQGWYKGKTKPNTLTTSTTPTYNTTFDGNDDMTAVYKEEVPKASVTLTRTTAETVTSGGNVTWRATITNTSQAPLTTATIKKSTAWTTGLAAPTAMIVTPVGGTAKTVPVTATTWTNGVSLGTDIPVGKSATVQFTTKATGTAGQVLRAGITTSGNYSGISASATVRVKDNDQTIVTPTAEGFISVPTFNFGQIGIAGNTQQHGLKKAADYYGNGTRNPYLRIKKNQPNWSLTAQLSQPKSATDSLPTATRLLLGAAPVSSFSNYNQPTELKNTIGTTKVINLTANNTATNIVANQQFTGSNVYQLDFVFDNIKLEVPASQGMTGQQYQAAVTWNLVTGP